MWKTLCALYYFLGHHTVMVLYRYCHMQSKMINAQYCKSAGSHRTISSDTVYSVQLNMLCYIYVDYIVVKVMMTLLQNYV